MDRRCGLLRARCLWAALAIAVCVRKRYILRLADGLVSPIAIGVGFDHRNGYVTSNAERNGFVVALRYACVTHAHTQCVAAGPVSL